MRFIEFKPTYKNKQKFKKFFFPLTFKKSNYIQFYPVKFEKQGTAVLHLRKPNKPFSFFNYFFNGLKKQQRRIFQIQLKSTSYFFVNQITISVVSRLLAPFFRGKKIKNTSSLSFSQFSTFNFTKKPLAVRIGGGVGKKIRKTGFFVKPGTSILKIYTRSPEKLFFRIERLKKKFSGSTQLLVILL
jgi:ribosomal protein L16/L10AE